jgi:threonine dehydrogenase-like Zn-dependent dehydrogenase
VLAATGRRAWKGSSQRPDTPYVIRECIQACRKGGTIAMLGVYGGVVDKFPLGALMNTGVQLRSGQVHAQRYIARLLEHVERGDVDPSFVATHEMSLAEAQNAYQAFAPASEAVCRRSPLARRRAARARTPPRWSG